MYKVLKFCHDLQDNCHPYNVGDIYPREGLEVSAERLAELSSTSNKRGEALIVLVEETPKKPARKTAKK